MRGCADAGWWTAALACALDMGAVNRPALAVQHADMVGNLIDGIALLEVQIADKAAPS